ncbi:MAG: glycine--tRNA ligase subunit beta, partial [Parabacteroides sp.]|nr:glycine--tRNA ligase subunit beta [Parabacteroides sp.]
IMGEYYARHDREDASVALAIREHYQPRFAGDSLPSTRVSLSVALADKIETLVGLFGVGQLPTGDKDPFALRRHALGILRMLVERELPISLNELIEIATQEESVVPTVKDASKELKNFFIDRLRVMLRDQGYSALEIEAVIQTEPDLLLDVPRRLRAVRQFMTLREAESLAAANKRIENILKKTTDKLVADVNPKLFTEPEEQALWDRLQQVRVEVDEDYLSGRYEAVLMALAPLKEPVDKFFDKVMANVDDENVRRNRYALLRTLHTTMNQVAKLSCLAS